MVDSTVLTAIWAIAALQLSLQAGNVVNAYRLTRLTGSFRAWTMIILAFTLTTGSSLFGQFVLIDNPDLINGLLSSIPIQTLVVSYTISITTSILLFLGIFDLVRRFQHAAKTP
jgi:hypothetical protein